MAYSSDPVVHNHLLFSQLFLDEVRSDTHDLAHVRPTFSTIQGTWKYHIPASIDFTGPTWAPAAPIPLDNPVELRGKVIEQVFAYLQLIYGPCKANEHSLLLYADRTREDCAGLCLVLPYTANIEGRDPKTGIIPKGRNYAQQLIHLLRQHDLDWGVLTNGRHWRLFHRTELSPTETYLHIDLERIIATDDIQNYVVFHRFFNRPAFARQDSRQRLDLYKQQSDRRTEIIEDHLSAHVEEIARQLCQGLVQSRRAAGEEVASRETRMAIYKNALFLVYRLLFVLYAEARDLLPLDVPAYHNVCLRDLLAEVCATHEHGMQYDNAYGMWDRLQALFALIDQGDSVAGVPAYNGGLFDPGRRPFLTKHHVRNEYLQAALIRLSTMPAKGKSYDQDRTPRSIDYCDLSVRHLGSLYEGLLEYNLFVVEDEQRVVRVSKKKTQYVPYSQAGKVRSKETILEVGDVYFSGTEGERKATGSYYTPEDVVDYIVCNTVGEKLSELKSGFYEEHDIKRQLADLADTPCDIPAHHQIQRAVDDQFVRFVREEVLDLKILDPAMGSGHFLVNATHAVANFVVELLSETPWQNQEIDTDVATWNRQVAERCIFGVDLNELAVELAKLCLWMTTTAKGKPLTFLDHHLRWGNSLVGAWLKEVGIYPLSKRVCEHVFTIPMDRFEVQLDQVLTGYQRLYAKSSDDVDEVREKARIFEEEIYPALQAYRGLLDLHTGVYFRNGLEEMTYAQMGRAVDDPAAWARLKAQGVGDLLAQHTVWHWFHWELEFPEVFMASVPGFDIVLGNPPYGRYGVLDAKERQFVRQREYPFGSGDSAEAFSAHALRLTGERGLTSFIIPKSFTYVRSWNGIREELISGASLISLCDVSEAFQQVLLEQVIFCSRQGVIREHDSVSVDRIAGLGRQHRTEVARNLFTREYFPTCMTPTGLSIALRMREIGKPISNYCSVWYGKGGATPDLNTTGDGIPVLRGKEVGRYRFRKEYEQWYLPEVCCKRGQPRRSLEQKIVAQDIVAYIHNPSPHIKLAAAIDEDGRLCLNTLTCFATKDCGYSLEMILAVLNSRLLSWYVHNFIFNGAVRTMHFMPGYADRWPMVDIDFGQAPTNRREIAKEIEELIYSDKLVEALQAIDKIPGSQERLVILHDTLSILARRMMAEGDDHIDRVIDRLVCKLYGIAPAHARLIEQGML